MADPSPSSTDGTDDAPPSTTGEGGGEDGEKVQTDVETLRQQVEEKYDFDDFGPEDMAEMSVDEWEAAFDPETWVVGPELLDRVEQDLKGRIATRNVFAVVERFEAGAEGEERLVAYSDEGYAIVAPDGSVEGRGTVMRDVKPTVALCSMESYEVPKAPDDVSLPDPSDVPEGTGQLGNNLLQFIAFAQILTGLGLVAAWLFTDAVPTARGVVNLVPPVVSLVFVGIGIFLFAVVANARLSDRFRAEEFRNRLRAVGVDENDRPDFLPPIEEGSAESDESTETAPAGGTSPDPD
ncbi:DUF7319 domain-containing protein [Haloplanus sp.]|uniref:DUF7319 domain-containing protein n=1 Tax=Haloplanus sp. TaxID=1961696 RepID=UPI002615790D|nr:hypothetical protein [Haloplanus sp.]